MTRTEIKKLVDSGTITFEEFTENSDMVFAAIKDRYGEVVDLGNNIICIKDTNGDVVKNDGESLRTLDELMTKAHSDSDALIGILRYLIGLGTDKSIVTMFMELLKRDIRNNILTTVLNRVVMDDSGDDNDGDNNSEPYIIQ